MEFPDLQGCLPCGEKIEVAIKNAKEAMILHLIGMEEDNDYIKEPSEIKDIILENNQTLVLIDAWMPPFRDKMANKVVNKTLTLPRWLNDMAEKEKVNFSNILQNALKGHLGVDSYLPVKIKGKKNI